MGSASCVGLKILQRKELFMTMDITAIILAIISFLSGLGWMLDRKKHRQEVESLKADNRMKDMELGKAYVDELSELFLLRASAIPERAQMALGLASVSQ